MTGMVTDYLLAFNNGESLSTSTGTVIIRTHEVARLKLPSGRIVACDPLVMPDMPPFEYQVTPGSYPVVLSVADFGTDMRVACAMVRFGDELARAWRMACQPGQEESSLKAGEIFGYGVDSGTGSFLDHEGAKALQAKMAADDNYWQLLDNQINARYVDTWTWADIPLTPTTNLVAFSSGFGDGFYSSFFGFGSNGQPVCLVTDFGVLFEELKLTPSTATPVRKWWQFWK